MTDETRDEDMAALANFARVFWDAAVREVEAQIEAEEADQSDTKNKEADQ